MTQKTNTGILSNVSVIEDFIQAEIERRSWDDEDKFRAAAEASQAALNEIKFDIYGLIDTLREARDLIYDRQSLNDKIYAKICDTIVKARGD